MKICSRQGYFELVSVNHSARTGGKIEISNRLNEGILCLPQVKCYGSKTKMESPEVEMISQQCSFSQITLLYSISSLLRLL